MEPKVVEKQDMPDWDKESADRRTTLETKEAVEKRLGRHIPHLHLLFEASPDCLKLIDADGRLLGMNANGCRLMEIDDFTALEGQPWASFWPEPERIEQALTEAKTLGFAQFQAPCPTAKGTPKWWDVQVTRVGNDTSESFSFLSGSRDISHLKHTEEALKAANESLRAANALLERRAALRQEERDAVSHALVDEIKLRGETEAALEDNEQRLRRILDSMSDGILVRNEKGVLTNVNPRAEALLGLSWAQIEGSAPTAAGWGLVEDSAGGLPVSLASLCSGEVENGRVLGVRQADGMLTWVLVNTSSFTLGGATGGTVTSLSDVTELHSAKDDLELYTEQLERSNRDLEDFAYVASHDLQEPLRMVSSYVQLLERRYGDKLDDKAKSYIAHAVDGATRMKALINDLLDYSRVNKRGAAFVRVAANAVFEEALLRLKDEQDASGARITWDDLPFVYGDGKQLITVFYNLLDNAIKYRKEAPPDIHITAEAIQNGAIDEWCFAVHDKGIGVQNKYLETIFTLFSRLNTRDKFAGNGVGLSMCRRILERHGGRIWAESEFGFGTSIYFTLPCRPVAVRS